MRTCRKKVRRITSGLPTLFLDSVPTAALRATAIKIKTYFVLRNNRLEVIFNSGPPVAVAVEEDRAGSYVTGALPIGRSKSHRRLIMTKVTLLAPLSGSISHCFLFFFSGRESRDQAVHILLQQALQQALLKETSLRQ